MKPLLRVLVGELDCRLGEVAMDVEEPHVAEPCFRRALELKSDWADAHASLGDVLSVRKQAAEAIIEYSTAIRQRPKFGFPKAQQNLERIRAERMSASGQWQWGAQTSMVKTGGKKK